VYGLDADLLQSSKEVLTAVSKPQSHEEGGAYFCHINRVLDFLGAQILGHVAKQGEMMRF
jgi:hypothetical protein